MRTIKKFNKIELLNTTRGKVQRDVLKIMLEDKRNFPYSIKLLEYKTNHSFQAISNTLNILRRKGIVKKIKNDFGVFVFTLIYDLEGKK